MQGGIGCERKQAVGRQNNSNIYVLISMSRDCIPIDPVLEPILMDAVLGFLDPIYSIGFIVIQIRRRIEIRNFSDTRNPNS